MIKKLYVVLCFITLGLSAASSAAPLKLKTMSIAEAKRALKDPGHDDYTSAINSILSSDMKEADRVSVLFSFFTDLSKLERLEDQHQGNASVSEALDLCLGKLKYPSKFVVSLYDSRIYSADTYESKRQQHNLILAINGMKDPSDEVIKRVADIKDLKNASNRFYTLAKHADDAVLKRALSLAYAGIKRWEDDGIPSAMREVRHRPLVFGYYVDRYLEYKYPKNLLLMILYDENGGERYGSFRNVRPEDACFFIEQIDRILAVKDQIAQLKDDYLRLKKTELERLQKIRQLMVLHNEVAEIKDDKDIRFRHYSVLAAHAKDEDLKRILARTRSMKKDYQVESLPLAMRESRHRPLVFTYYVDSLLKFRSKKTLKIIAGALYLHEGKYLTMSPYDHVAEKDAALFVQQIKRIKQLKLKDAKLPAFVEELDRILDMMEKKAASHQSDTGREKR